MYFGFLVLVIGYTLFYWGLHHVPQCEGKDRPCPRYSLWALFGFGTLFKNLSMPGTPGGTEGTPPIKLRTQ